MRYQATIGLEIHIQLKTASKLFCSCPTGVVEDPNSQVCEVCLGYPGVLPRLNRAVVEQGVRVVQALGMEVARELRFDRKHYVYPDLAKSFQTSQFYVTLARRGEVELEVRQQPVTVRLREAHLEEDAAKLDHTPYDSKVDFNRAGTPLLEVVTEPDLHFGEEAEALLKHMQLLVQTIRASDAHPELGQLRCDVNISVAREGGHLGTRVEIKNLNSPRFVRLAIEAEYERHVRLLEAGERVVRETRGWNENRGVTASMRSKEQAHDYRYLGEPDIPVVILSDHELERIAGSVAELPDARVSRFVRDFGVKKSVACELVSDPAAADYFEGCVRALGDGELAAAWTLNQVREIEKQHDSPFDPPRVAPESLARLLRLLIDERISTASAKRVLGMMMTSSEDPFELVTSNGLEQVSDEETIRVWVGNVIGGNPEAVESFRDGKAQSFQFLVGKVMRESRGRANPRIVREQMQIALSLRRVAVVDMGGAITARRGPDGALTSSPQSNLEAILEPVRGSRQELRIEPLPVAHELSENLTPHEWFELWVTLRSIVKDANYEGVVVTHGLDTLAYTASLMRWLIPGVQLPIVFTGATRGPEDPDSDARPNLAAAVDLAGGGAGSGFWISMGGEVLPAVNVRMVGIGESCFAAFNLDSSKGQKGLATGSWGEIEPDEKALDLATRRVLVVKVYPGLDPGVILEAVREGVRFVLLELFDTGTGNARWDARQSLLPLIREVTHRQGAVFCTSQLAVPVNMQEFESSRELWGAGVVPLGRLVTESAYTKLIAAQMLADDADNVIRLMAGEEFSL